MTKEDFKKSLSALSGFTGSADVVEKILWRCAGFAEAVESFLKIKGISDSINQNEIDLLKLLMKVIYSVQLQLLDAQEDVDKYKNFQNENQDLKRLLGDSLEEQNRLRDELSKKGLKNED